MSLRKDFELVFSSGASGVLLIDPSELAGLFPDATYMEIYELVHRYSLEALELLKLDADDEIPSGARDYVLAAAACALTRLYDLSGIGAGGDGAFRLGDLSVESARSGGAPSQMTRATASTWCELAAVLRDELITGRTGASIRAIVKGSAYPNPMPCRGIREKEDMPMTVWADDYGRSSVDWTRQ
jgi:hypothetical protein